jgi:hypothetical protein
VSSFISVSVPKAVNVFLFSPTRATFTVHHIQLFAVQYKTWSYLLRSFPPTLSPNYTNTYSSVLIYIYVWLVNLFDALCLCYTFIAMSIKKLKVVLLINTEEKKWTLLHFPISFSEIWILRQFEYNVEHILFHTNLKLDGEAEITWI